MYYLHYLHELHGEVYFSVSSVISVVKPVPDGVVQNERTGCPKWGSPLCGSEKREKLDKLKVKAVKQNNNMLNDSLNPRNARGSSKVF